MSALAESRVGQLFARGTKNLQRAYITATQWRRAAWEWAVTHVPVWNEEGRESERALEGEDALLRVREGLKRPILAVMGFSVVTNLLALTVPIYTAQIYDRVLTSYSVATLVMLTIMALGLLGLLVGLDNIRNKILTRAALKSEQVLSPPLLAAAVQDQLAGRTDAGLPLRDLSALRTFAMTPVLPTLFDIPIVPLCVVVAYLIHPILGVTAFSGLLGMAALAAANQRATSKRLADAGKGANALLVAAELQLRNADVIQAMGLMSGLAKRWRKNHDQALHEQVSASNEGGPYQMGTRYLRLALQILVLAFGAGLVLGGKITPGMMFAAVIILSRGLQPIEVAVGSWRALISAKGNYERIESALLRATSLRDSMALPPPQGRIDVEAVHLVAGPERRPVLRGVSFALAPGEVLGVIGPAASGKSTLARVVLGVWAPTVGKARLDGADVSQWPRADLGRYVGYLPQEIELFPGTVAENIARMSEPDAVAVVAAAKWAGIHELVLRLPQGYDTRIMAGGLALSPGQRQRIALARALYGVPKLIVLDEPNSNLDGEGEESLSRALKEASARGITVILIAHRLGVLRHTNKVLLLHDGVMQAFGKRDEILAMLAQNHGRPHTGTVVPMLNTVRRQGGSP